MRMPPLHAAFVGAEHFLAGMLRLLECRAALFAARFPACRLLHGGWNLFLSSTNVISSAIRFYCVDGDMQQAGNLRAAFAFLPVLDQPGFIRICHGALLS